MYIDRPFAVSSESEEEYEDIEKEFFDEYERDLEEVTECLSLYNLDDDDDDDDSDDDSDYTSETDDDESDDSTSSESDESSEEMEAEEITQSRAFIQALSFNPCITPYELGQLVTAPQSTKRREEEEAGDMDVEEHQPQPAAPPLLAASKEDRIVDEDRHRVVLRIEGYDTYMDVMFENYVHVSYFCNERGGKYRLALRDLATHLLGYGAQYSKNKFTKLTIRYLNGPSHYLFGSGVLVESGTYSEAIAYKTHHHTMRILAERCNHENIAVKKRKCQNIVAKGTLPFELCLVLLKHKYPNCVQYDCDDFAGAIIRPGDMDNEIEEEERRERRRVRRYRKIAEQLTNDLTVQGTSGALGDDWDDDEEVTSSSSSSEDEDDEDEDDDDDDDDSSYEYFEEFPFEEMTCHPDFDYNARDKEERDLNEALLQKQEDESQYRVLEKKPLRRKDLLQLHNAEDLDDYQVSALTKKKKVTVLVFPKGCAICAGCKKDKEVHRAFIKVFPLLVSVRANERNKAAQADIIKRGLY